jgi:hypothetical protein
LQGSVHIGALHGQCQLTVGHVLDAIDAPGKDVEIDTGFACHAPERWRPCGFATKRQTHDAARYVLIRNILSGRFFRQCFAHEALRSGMRRMQEDIGNRSLFDNTPSIEHRNAIANAAHDIHFMCDEHDGEFQLAIDFREKVQNRCRGLRIERASGFVAK